MDEETQSKVPSDVTAEPVSDIDTKLGCHILPTVVNLANQVSFELRQTHSEIFSRLPIVVIHRYEPEKKLPVEVTDTTVSNVLPNISTKINDTKDFKSQIKLNETVDSDESLVSDGPSSSILSNNDSTICSKRLILHELLENKTKIYRPIDNSIVEQTETCNLNMNFQDELSNRPSSNSVLLNNEPTNCTKKTWHNELSDSENKKLNKSVQNVENENDHDVNNMKFKKEIFVFKGDMKDSEEFSRPPDPGDIKKIVKHMYAKTKKHNNNRGNVLNVDGIKDHEMINKLTSIENCVKLDHDYYRTLSPENLQKERDDFIRIKNNIYKNFTSLGPEVAKFMNDYDGYVVDEPQFNSKSSPKNTNINQMVASDSIDTINEVPTSVAGEVFENVEIDNDSALDSLNMPTFFQMYDEQMWQEFAEDVNTAQQFILPRLLDVFEKDDLTFGEMEKLVTEKISEVMQSNFDTHFTRKNRQFMERKEENWRQQYESLLKQLNGMNTIVDKHKEDVKEDENAIPRKLRRHVKVQTKRPKLNDFEHFEPQLQNPITAMHFTTDPKSVVLDSTDSKKQNSKQTKNTIQTKTLGISAQTLTNNDSDGTYVLPTCSSSFTIHSNSTATLDTLTQTFINNDSGCVPVLPTYSSSVIQSSPAATLGISTQTLLNNNSGCVSVLPNCSSNFTISSNTTATLGSSTQYLSNSNSNFISVLPTYPSSFQPVPQVSNQTVMDPTHFTFTTNSDNLSYPSLYMLNGNNIPIRLRPGVQIMSQNPKLGSYKICSIRSINPSQNHLQYLRPVPPAIPIEDDEPPVSRDHRPPRDHQELPSLKQLLQAPTKRSLRSKTRKDKSYKTKPIETISLLSPENSDESDTEVAELSSIIETPEYPPAGKRLIPAKLSNISYTQISQRDSPLIETIDLSTPEPSEQLEIYDSTTSSDITNQKCTKDTLREISSQKRLIATPSKIVKRKCARIQQSSKPMALKKKQRVARYIARKKRAKTHDPLPLKIVNLSSPTSSEITNQKNASSEPSSKLTQLNETSKDAADIMPNENSASTSNERNVTLPSQDVRITDLIKNKAKQSEQNKHSWKLLPPAPILRIGLEQTPEDFQLMLDINLDSRFADIKGFLLYCYHKKNSSDRPRNSKSWKELGQVNMNIGPIKCVLKKRSHNIKCLFTARAVDIHNRIGPCSEPKFAFLD